jgi:hypothetical protein
METLDFLTVLHSFHKGSGSGEQAERPTRSVPKDDGLAFATRRQVVTGALSQFLESVRTL